MALPRLAKSAELTSEVKGQADTLSAEEWLISTTVVVYILIYLLSVLIFIDK